MVSNAPVCAAAITWISATPPSTSTLNIDRPHPLPETPFHWTGAGRSSCSGQPIPPSTPPATPPHGPGRASAQSRDRYIGLTEHLVEPARGCGYYGFDRDETATRCSARRQTLLTNPRPLPSTGAPPPDGPPRGNDALCFNGTDRQIRARVCRRPARCSKHFQPRRRPWSGRFRSPHYASWETTPAPPAYQEPPPPPRHDLLRQHRRPHRHRGGAPRRRTCNYWMGQQKAGAA